MDSQTGQSLTTVLAPLIAVIYASSTASIDGRCIDRRTSAWTSPGDRFTAFRRGEWRRANSSSATYLFAYISMSIDPPTILGTRAVPGIPHSTLPGNLTWSDDGQAAFFTSRGIHIFVRALLLLCRSVADMADTAFDHSSCAYLYYRH